MWSRAGTPAGPGPGTRGGRAPQERRAAVAGLARDCHGVLDGGADLAEERVEFTLPVQEFRSAEALEWHDPDTVDSYRWRGTLGAIWPGPLMRDGALMTAAELRKGQSFKHLVGVEFDRVISGTRRRAW